MNNVAATITRGGIDYPPPAISGNGAAIAPAAREQFYTQSLRVALLQPCNASNRVGNPLLGAKLALSNQGNEVQGSNVEESLFAEAFEAAGEAVAKTFRPLVPVASHV